MTKKQQRQRAEDANAARVAGQRVYSGTASVQFWQRIKRAEARTKSRDLYTLGIILQETESRVLGALEEAERR